MNLWFRLLWMLSTAWHRPSLALSSGAARLSFRVWPHDLDTSLHMNNGRYWTLMDMGRIDLIIRLGLLRPVLRNGWTPVVSAGSIRFRRELRLLQAFYIETRLVFWNDARFVIEQRFVTRKTETVASIALVLGGLYDRKRKAFVPVNTILELSGLNVESPAMTAEIDAFLKGDDALREATSQPR
jgi:acyl-CoA thioesterase FadM